MNLSSFSLCFLCFPISFQDQIMKVRGEEGAAEKPAGEGGAVKQEPPDTGI